MLCCVTPTRSHLFFSLSLTICFIYDSVYFVQPIQKHCKKQRPQHQIKSLQKYIYTSHITKEIQFRVENERKIHSSSWNKTSIVLLPKSSLHTINIAGIWNWNLGIPHSLSYWNKLESSFIRNIFRYSKFKFQLIKWILQSLKFKSLTAIRTRYANCQVPSFIFTKKKMRDAPDKEKVSRSIIIFMPWLIIWRVEDYMMKGQNCSDMTPQSPRTCPDLFFLILYFLYLLFLPRLQTKHLELNFFFFFQERQ